MDMRSEKVCRSSVPQTGNGSASSPEQRADVGTVICYRTPLLAGRARAALAVKLDLTKLGSSKRAPFSLVPGQRSCTSFPFLCCPLQRLGFNPSDDATPKLRSSASTEPVLSDLQAAQK